MGFFKKKAAHQAEEIKTIAPRALRLNLSDADVERVAAYAAKGGMTVSELLENFIGDLVDGTYSNGSDERMYAKAWYERCGFSFMPASDIAIFAENDVLDTLIDACDRYWEAEQQWEELRVRFVAGEAEEVTAAINDTEELLTECQEDIEALLQEFSCTDSSIKILEDVAKWKAELAILRKRG